MILLIRSLPALPSAFHGAIGSETCVWLNAFSGRVYRDAARSEYFHGWFCSKLAKMLNKGKRPDYIDEFAVSDVSFGALPPLVRNMKWVPQENGGQVRRCYLYSL